MSGWHDRTRASDLRLAGDQRAVRVDIVSTMLAVVAAGICALSADGAEAMRELGTVESRRLTEVSGLVASQQNPGILWMHDDGPAKEVCAVRLNGKVAARVALPVEVETEDLEDIAIGPGPTDGVDYLYVGDIGDNAQPRREIRVIRIAEPDLEQSKGNRLTATDVATFRFEYLDGAFDAETLLVDPLTGDLIVVTKQRGRAAVYVVRAADLHEDELVSMTRIGVLRLDRVTGGDISRDGAILILRNKEHGWLWTRQDDEPLEAALRRPPQSVPVRGAEQGEKGEAVAFHPTGLAYYTISEGPSETIYVFGFRPDDR